jgi:hypothetical protein
MFCQTNSNKVSKENKNDTEAQLYEWLKWFDEHNFVIERKLKPKNQVSMDLISLMMGKHETIRMIRKS